MSPWPFLALVALGHVCLACLWVNVTHGLGLNEGWPIKLMKLASIALVGSITLAMLATSLGDPWEYWSWPARGYSLLCALVAGVGLPIATVGRLIRRTPAGIAGRSRTVDLTDSIPRRELIGRAHDSFWLHLPLNECFRLETTEWEVTSPRLPEALDGLSILHLTDLHLTPAYSDRFFEAILDQVAGVEADLVVFTGDLIDDVRMLDRVGPLLGRFRGRLGNFGILGNHDYRYEIAGPTAALESAGFDVIEGRWSQVRSGDAAIAVGGTSSPWGPRPDPAAIPEADVRLLLSHSPDPLAWAASIGVDLMLSGHTHGGQYRLPIVGPVLLPSRYSRRYDRGFFRRGPTLLYVSRGIGAQHPLRYNCPPEISLFRLRRVRLASGPSFRVADRDRRAVAPIDHV